MATTQAPRARPARAPRRRSSSQGTVVVAALVVLVGAVGAGWAWLHGSVGSIPVRQYCTALVGDSMGDVDPEQAGNAAVISAVAVRRGLPARAASIGIATAMQESKLRNIDYGDRDSLGLFQQRPSQGWGTAKQVQDPVYASNAFYDVLVKIEGYQSLPITDAAQKVQRSAFPSAYQQHEPEARALASALTGYSPATFTCTLRSADVAVQTPGAKGLTPRAAALVAAARTETGRTGVADAANDTTGPDGDARGTRGTAVKFALAGREGSRLAWALASWAVARADGLAVTSVQVDGRQWRRDESDKGWTTLADGPPTGTVVVHVAAGG